MSSTRVVKLKRQNGKVVQGCDVYIGRECYMGGWKLPRSIWHNPFSVKNYGLQNALNMYEQYLCNSPELMGQLYTLQGKTLGCWCDPNPCHGHILQRYVDNLKPKVILNIVPE